MIKKKFACNGTIVSDSEMGEVIQLQGDQRKDVQEFLTDKKEGLGLEAPTVKAVKNDYFSGAPLGQIFGAAAQEIPDKQVLGRKDGTIKDIFSQGLTLIESQNKSPDDAWNTTDERVKKAVG